jgi:hypothetical protein
MFLYPGGSSVQIVDRKDAPVDVMKNVLRNIFTIPENRMHSYPPQSLTKETICHRKRLGIKPNVVELRLS